MGQDIARPGIARSVGAAVLLICLFAFASLATAGPPKHVQGPDPIAGFALDHSCGVAADSAGDLYVSNAGQDKIEVFDPAGAHLTSIANVNEPCGLAVDSHGTLFVTEKGTGKVVRYVPDEPPPFAGTPSFDSAEEIDASGDASGIAVDTTVILTGSNRPTGGDDSLFIANGDHVEAYRNERQGVSVSGTAGTYTLEFEGQVTGPIDHDASHQEVQEALEDLTTVGSGNVFVTTANFGATDHLIAFVGNLGLSNVPKLEVDKGGLTGNISQSTPTQGGRVGNETQSVTVANTTTGGTFTLRFDGQTTDPIAFNATAAIVQGELEDLSNIAPGDVAVSGGPGPLASYDIAFAGAYTATDVPQLEVASSLTPNEVQRITVNASAGSYTLTATTGSGSGKRNAGSNLLSDVKVSFGAFNVGSPITAEGFPVGTTVTAVGVGTLTLSNVATSGSETSTSLTAQEITAPIAYNAVANEGEGAGSMEAALEALVNIASGDVAVSGGPGGPGGLSPYLVSFAGTFAGANIPQMSSTIGGLTGTAAVTTVTQGASISVSTPSPGWNGQMGAGDLSEPTGVAAYTYQASGSQFTRYLYVADDDGDTVEVFSGSALTSLELRRTIEDVLVDHDEDPETPEHEQVLGFGPAGAYLAVDRGNGVPGAIDAGEATRKCEQVGEQACTAGHLLVYNDAQDAVEEFDASGQFLDRIRSDDFEDAAPTGLAVERSGGADDGTIYVTAGTGAGAKVLSFGPLVMPGREEIDSLSQVLADAKAVAVDPFGDVYVAAGPGIHVFDPEGAPLTTIPNARLPFDLAVDSECNVYVLDGSGSDQQMTYYEPSACPPPSSGSFDRHEPPIVPSQLGLRGVAVSPTNDHVFVHRGGFPAPIAEFGPPSGSSLVRECGAGLGLVVGSTIDLAVYGDGSGEDGRAYLSENSRKIIGVDCGPSEGSEEVVVRTTGAGGCVNGIIEANPAIAVDQSNGHVLQFEPGQAGEGAREYDASLACVAEFGNGTFPDSPGKYAIAVDNGPTSPNRGNAYVAFDGNNEAVQPFDLTAFTPLSYGEAPKVEAGIASGIGVGTATLKGTVVPHHPLEACRFEYLTETAYDDNVDASDPPFEGATSQDCEEELVDIGSGDAPFPVHVDLSGLSPSPQTDRYRFRLVAENKFGPDEDSGLFGPPVPTTDLAAPILYDEATLRGTVDPSGLATTYFFEYGTTEAYGQSTPTIELDPGDGPVAVEASLTGLAEGTEYHFRLVAANEADEVEGIDREFETLERLAIRSCPNTEYRTGLSAKLPDCRAYELVTPADTRTATPSASLFMNFNTWLVDPRGPSAGESVGFYAGTLPGFEGTGETDGYRATRADGAHPEAGWQTEFYGPTYAQLGGFTGNQQEGVSADQRYWLWSRGGADAPGSLPLGHYLRVPDGEAEPECNADPETYFEDEFELVGCGSQGVDAQAASSFTSAGGEHVIFTSEEQLEPEAAPGGTTQSIYERKAGSAEAEVVSLDPDGNPFGADASYVGASEDGSTILFKVGGTLYARRGGETIEVALSPNTFAGVSDDGARVFWVGAASGEAPSDLFACDLDDAGPCPAGSGAEFASAAIFVGISPDGTHAYFTSELALTGGEANDNGETAEASEANLYAWDGAGTRFVAILDSADFVDFGPEVPGPIVNLLQWTKSINPSTIGRADTPTRATPDGGAFLFQSHAQLTDYVNEGVGQIYRFAPGAPAGERLLCISCDPTGGLASGDAMLQIYGGASGGRTVGTTMIPNVTDNGASIFFNSPDQLVPEDANQAVDVYQWRANGSGEGSEECERARGCLVLISSGQGQQQSTLYGMSADGHDVFFSTREKLVGADLVGSDSIYDARIEGGIPDPPLSAPCQGDACQGEGSVPPTLPAPASGAPLGDGDVPPQGKEQPGKRCAKGKRKVKRKGKVRCVKKKQKSKRRAGGKRGGAR